MCNNFYYKQINIHFTTLPQLLVDVSAVDHPDGGVHAQALPGPGLVQRAVVCVQHVLDMDTE